MKEDSPTPNTFLNQFKNQEEFSVFVSKTYKSGIEEKFDNKLNAILKFL